MPRGGHEQLLLVRGQHGSLRATYDHRWLLSIFFWSLSWISAHGMPHAFIITNTPANARTGNAESGLERARTDAEKEVADKRKIVAEQLEKIAALEQELERVEKERRGLAGMCACLNVCVRTRVRVSPSACVRAHALHYICRFSPDAPVRCKY